MKKIIFTLFTILCAVQLYGMNENLGNLSPEVQVMIIQALNSYDNPVDTIKAIIRISKTNQQLNNVVNDMYGNLKGFTNLVHVLADKHNKTTKEIADIFKTPLAATYVKLGEDLTYLVVGERLPYLAHLNQEKDKSVIISEIKQLIEKGADVNFTSFRDGSPLTVAVGKNDVELTQLLLTLGANPKLVANILKPSFKKYDEKIIELIKKALEKEK